MANAYSEDDDIWGKKDEELEDWDNSTLYDELYHQLELDGERNTEASIKQNLHKWETVEVKFGIVSRSASKTSAFIKLLLDLSPSDSSYAKRDEGGCTIFTKEYEHPKFNTFKLVEFPAFGTPNMTESGFRTYLDRVSLHHFVFIDIVLKEKDMWLTTQLEQKGIAYSLFSSKLDEFTTNKANEQELIQLLKHITPLIPKDKAEALIFFLPLLNKELILAKCNLLRNRIKSAAFAAGVFGVIPIPYVGVPMKVEFVMEEVSRYIRILHLDNQYAKEVPGLEHPSLNDNKLLHSIRAQITISSSKLLDVCALEGDWVLVGIESNRTKTLAIDFMAYYLNSELEKLREDANVVYDYYQKKISTT